VVNSFARGFRTPRRPIFCRRAPWASRLVSPSTKSTLARIASSAVHTKADTRGYATSPTPPSCSSRKSLHSVSSFSMFPATRSSPKIATIASNSSDVTASRTAVHTSPMPAGVSLPAGLLAANDDPVPVSTTTLVALSTLRSMLLISRAAPFRACAPSTTGTSSFAARHVSPGVYRRMFDIPAGRSPQYDIVSLPEPTAS